MLIEGTNDLNNSMNNPEDALRGLNMLVCGSEEGLLAVSFVMIYLLNYNYFFGGGEMGGVLEGSVLEWVEVDDDLRGLSVLVFGREEGILRFK